MNSNLPPSSGANQIIFVRQIRPSPKPGATKGYADIQYHNAVIKGFSVVADKNGGSFVGFPAHVSNGKRFYIVEFSEPERSQIAKLILEAAKEILQ